MTAVKSAVRRAALFLFILLLAACAKGEDLTMGNIPVTLYAGKALSLIIATHSFRQFH